MPASCLAAYGVSKAGMECFSDVLRVEMQRWGVKVAIVEPAGFKTGTVCVHACMHVCMFMSGHLCY